MDFDSQNQHEEEATADQEGCLMEKNPLPSNKIRIKKPRRNDEDGVVSADFSLGVRNHSRPAGEGKSYVDDLMKDGKPTCNLCNKGFVSLKSLFGHMRCHPERHWRGMQQPPPSPSPNCSEIADVADGGSRLDLPPGWSIKDKRGRKSSVNYEDDDDDKEKLYNAAHGLLNLAESIDDQDSKIKDKTVIKCYKCVVCDKSFASHRALGGHRSSAHNKILIKITGQVSVVKDEIFENKSCGKVLEEECDNLNEDINTKNHYVCRICEKAFSSGQALGGHQRLHWQGPMGGRELAPPSSSSSSTSPAGQQLMNRKLAFDFDLNEIPDDDGDDQREV